MTNATLTWLVLSVVAGMLALAFMLQMAGRDGHPLGLLGPHWLYLWLCVGAVGMAGASLFAYLTTAAKIRDQDAQGARLMAVIGLADALKDCERGEFGFLLTGRESYKAPYTRARSRIKQQCDRLKAAYAASDELPRAEAACRLAEVKLREIDRTIALRERGDKEGALAALSTDAGRNTMELIGIAASELSGRAFAAHAATQRDLIVLAEARVVMAMFVVVGFLACMAIAVFRLARPTAPPAGDAPRG